MHCRNANFMVQRCKIRHMLTAPIAMSMATAGSVPIALFAAGAYVDIVAGKRSTTHHVSTSAYFGFLNWIKQDIRPIQNSPVKKILSDGRPGIVLKGSESP